MSTPGFPPPRSRSMLLFGTDEPAAPLRKVKAGRLSAELDRGNLRYIRWDGRELVTLGGIAGRDGRIA